jgi:hypothetical protein
MARYGGCSRQSICCARDLFDTLVICSIASDPHVGNSATVLKAGMNQELHTSGEVRVT